MYFNIHHSTEWLPRMVMPWCIHKTMFYHSKMSKSWFIYLYSLDFSITLTCIYLSEHELRTSAKTQVPKLLGKVQAKTEMQLLQCNSGSEQKVQQPCTCFSKPFFFTAYLSDIRKYYIDHRGHNSRRNRDDSFNYIKFLFFKLT